MDNLPPIDEIYGQQTYQCYGQNDWTSQYSNSIEDLDRMTAFQSANESEARTVEATIEGLPSKRDVANKQAKPENVSRRGLSFSQEEDNIICSAFLNISKDSITGINQSSEGTTKESMTTFVSTNQKVPLEPSYLSNIGGKTSKEGLTYFVHTSHRWIGGTKVASVNKTVLKML